MYSKAVSFSTLI